jgi:hypothetical protein
MLKHKKPIKNSKFRDGSQRSRGRSETKPYEHKQVKNSENFIFHKNICRQAAFLSLCLCPSCFFCLLLLWSFAYFIFFLLFYKSIGSAMSDMLRRGHIDGWRQIWLVFYNSKLILELVPNFGLRPNISS